jgi:hypothetical protein
MKVIAAKFLVAVTVWVALAISMSTVSVAVLAWFVSAALVA